MNFGPYPCYLRCIQNMCDMFSNFYFLLPLYSTESTAFGPNFRNGDFHGFTRFEDPCFENSYF